MDLSRRIDHNLDLFLSQDRSFLVLTVGYHAYGFVSLEGEDLPTVTRLEE